MPWAKNFLSSRQNLDTVLSPLSDPTRLPPLASSWNVHPGLQSKQNSCICEHRLLFSPSSSSSIFHHLYPQTCMRTHTHFSHPQFSQSQAVTSPHMDTRASSDPRAHRVFTHPPCPFPASTCFSSASFSSAFSLWFCLLINCSRQTVGPPPRCGNTWGGLSLRDMGHTHLTLAGNWLLLRRLSTSFCPHPAGKQSKRSGFSRAFSIPGTGQSFVTLRHKNYFLQVSDNEIKAQRHSVTHLR